MAQTLDDGRNWSLPGGRVEAGETLEEAAVREIWEETGLTCGIVRLAYIADKPDADPPVLHLSFVMKPVGGKLTLPSNEHDANPISDVAFVAIDHLSSYGFSPKFIELARSGFPNPGYVGRKENIGL